MNTPTTSFAAQVANTKSRGSAAFKSGVATRRLSNSKKKNQNAPFRIMPAFARDANGVPDPNGWVNFRHPETREITDWGAVLRVARFIGYDNKIDFLSRQTFGEDCPLISLVNAAQSAKEWEYLADRDDRNSPLSYPSTLLAVNIVAFDAGQPGAVEIGLLPKSAMESLFAPKDGIMAAPNPDPGAASDPDWTAAYRYRDPTAPGQGFLLESQPRHEDRSISEYVVGPLLRNNQYVYDTYDVSLLAQRTDLRDVSGICEVLSNQEIVDLLVSKLVRRNGAGTHELALVRDVLGGQYTTPEPPATAAATVPGATLPGAAPMAPPQAPPVSPAVPAAGAAPAAQAPAAGAAPAAPAAGAAPAAPAAGAAPAAPAAQAPAAGAAPAAQAPAVQAPSPAAGVAPAVQAPSPAAGVAPAVQAPSPAVPTAGAPAAQAPAPSAPGVGQTMAPSGVPSTAGDGITQDDFVASMMAKADVPENGATPDAPAG